MLDRNQISSSKTMRRTINSLGYNIDGSRSNAELLAPVFVDSRSTADLALILTGMHIENILKNMHAKKPLASFSGKKHDSPNVVSSRRKLDGILTYTHLPIQNQKASNQMSHPVASKGSVINPLSQATSFRRSKHNLDKGGPKPI